MGKVFSDSLFLDNIHIVNKNSSYGTISNQYGIFKIPIKLEDTLIITGIQFYTKTLIISKNDLKNKIIAIALIQKTNELDEIELKSNPFSGNLVTDIEKIEINSIIEDGVLDFSNISFTPTTSDFDIRNDNGKPPDASKLTNPHIPIGLTLFKLGLGKPFKKKLPPVQQSIRKEYGDNFFIETLNIPLVQIDFFLGHCKNKKITKLYKMKKNLEFTDALIKESKIYLKKINDER